MLSVTIITRNEEKNLVPCLESVLFADEIVLVDSGSTDKTLEIAKHYPTKIFVEPWRGYAGQKNYAQEKASGPWILNIDADERVTPELRKEINTWLNRDHPYLGFRIPRKNYFGGQWIRHGGWYPNYILRLYRKEAGSFASREVHEQVRLQGKVGTLKSPLEHYTYESISDYLRRMDHYSDLSAAQYKKEGRRCSWPEILFRTAFTFLRMYFLQFGFLDRSPGLVLAVLYSYYTFTKYAKLLELYEKSKSPKPQSGPTY